jgi:hypothetical protein
MMTPMPAPPMVTSLVLRAQMNRLPRVTGFALRALEWSRR